MMGKMCLLVFGGKIEDTILFQQRLEEADLVMAADSGARHLLHVGVFPSRVYGDMDSLNADEIDVLEKAGCRLVVSPAEKDDTDGAITLAEALRMGYKDIRIWGALGGRPDHSYANIMLLQMTLASAYQENSRSNAVMNLSENTDMVNYGTVTDHIPDGAINDDGLLDGEMPDRDRQSDNIPDVVIEDRGVRIFLAKPGQWIEGKKASCLSIFALSSEVTGFTQTGLKYQPPGGRYTSSFPLGVSNEFIEEKACLNWETGILLCMQIDE